MLQVCSLLPIMMLPVDQEEVEGGQGYQHPLHLYGILLYKSSYFLSIVLIS